MRAIDPDLLPGEVLESSYRMGRLIAVARKARGLTQSQLCEAAGIGRSTLAEIERGSPRVQLAHWLAVMHVLQLLEGLTANLLSAEELERIAGAVRRPRSA